MVHSKQQQALLIGAVSGITTVLVMRLNINWLIQAGMIGIAVYLATRWVGRHDGRTK